MIYSNKILDDIFPADIQIYNEEKGGPPQMKVVTSKCCQAMIRAKMTDGRIEYLYCSKCHSKVDEKTMNNPDTE